MEDSVFFCINLIELLFKYISSSFHMTECRYGAINPVSLKLNVDIYKDISEK